MKNLVVPGIVLLLICQRGNAQTIASAVVNTSGGSYVHNHLSLEWSIGETPLVETMMASQNSAAITNGFLQPLNIKLNTAPIFQSDEIIILPNPSQDWIEVNVLTSQKGQLYLSLVDTHGRQLQNKKISITGTGQLERFNLSGYAAGVYFLSAQLDPSPGSVAKKGSYKIVKF
jgi:hypothetical protein